MENEEGVPYSESNTYNFTTEEKALLRASAEAIQQAQATMTVQLGTVLQLHGWTGTVTAMDLESGTVTIEPGAE